MNGPIPRTAQDTEREVAALIETLHRTGQRLEELTVGEVDAVVDREGHGFLLRHAQEHLRLGEAARQAAILNALPAHIALLDTQGRIVSVNEAWRRFANANGLASPDFGVGLNYLDVCSLPRAGYASDAQRAASGIRLVMSGGSKSFSLEYACHSPARQRWFLLTATPLVDDRLKGVVVTHVDVTERKRAAQKFEDLLEAAPDAMVIVNGAARVALCNARAVQLFGWRREDLLGQRIEVLLPKRLRGPHAGYRNVLSGTPRGLAPGARQELFGLHKDGSEFPIEVSLSPLDTDDGPVVISVIRDITERKAAQRTIARLNRVYAMLSGINNLIVRVRDRDALFKEACRFAVESGGFGMALVVLWEDTSKKIVPAAWAGKDEALMAAVNGLLASAERSPSTMLARAIREKRPIVANDSLTDPAVLISQQYADSGIRSIAVLPLLVGEEAVGALALYANEPAFFQDDELTLLLELAGDIAFAVDHLGKQERLNYLAYYDVLTGLANTSLFRERVAQSARVALLGGHKLAVFLIDLERFKSINDTLGQAVGDELLRQVAAWLTQRIGDASLLARLGADHFAALLPVVKFDGEVDHLVDDSLRALSAHPFRLGDTVFRISAKTGVAVFPDDGGDAETLFRNAEAALKQAKASGERCMFYAPDMNASVVARLTMENQLRQAVDNAEFELYYQPKVNLVSGKMTSAEALIRWNDPRSGLVPPGQFIPLLEQTGLIHEVGRWALRQAVADNLRWRDAGLRPVRIAVNVSALQLRHRGFIGELREAIASNPMAADGLEIEITESLLMEDVKHSIASLRAIRDLGICLAIDDFGTGFSSLSYLSKFPVDTLKIDRSFVIEMVLGPENLALVSTIISLAHALKLKVVAEGVETDEQARLLRLLNCDEMQGYLFSEPVPRAVFEARFLAVPQVG